jgi:hypothetical protein
MDTAAGNVCLQIFLANNAPAALVEPYLFFFYVSRKSVTDFVLITLATIALGVVILWV